MGEEYVTGGNVRTGGLRPIGPVTRRLWQVGLPTLTLGAHVAYITSMISLFTLLKQAYKITLLTATPADYSVRLDYVGAAQLPVLILLCCLLPFFGLIALAGSAYCLDNMIQRAAVARRPNLEKTAQITMLGLAILGVVSLLFAALLVFTNPVSHGGKNALAAVDDWAVTNLNAPTHFASAYNGLGDFVRESNIVTYDNTKVRVVVSQHGTTAAIHVVQTRGL